MGTWGISFNLDATSFLKHLERFLKIIIADEILDLGFQTLLFTNIEATQLDCYEQGSEIWGLYEETEATETD